MIAPAVPELMKDFNSTSTELAAFVVTVYVLGFATGPLILAPLSELYGRLIVYHITSFLFLVFSIACAVAPNLSSLIAFRYLAGCAGSAPLTLGGGTIADVIHPQSRGTAMAAFSAGPLLGPILGPIIGGYLSEAKGWRWIFWVLATLVRNFHFDISQNSFG